MRKLDTDPLTTISTRQTPQSQPADPRQVPNNAGGHVFTVDPVTRLRRFLVLGVDDGTYYVGERELTRDNAQVVLDLAATDPARLVAEVVAISTAGRAPRQQPTLFALAVAASVPESPADRQLALDALPLVVRTGTHLFIFARYIEQFRGWGRALQRAVARWYLDKPVDRLAYQALKYRQREGWSHRDLLRLAHPVTQENDRNALFRWIVSGEWDHGTHDLDALRMVDGWHAARAAKPADVARLVTEYGLSWEMLPDEALSLPGTWEALLDRGLPMTALIRQLPRLTNLGLLSPLDTRTTHVCGRLTDPISLRNARVHPVNVLISQRTYAQGHGERGRQTWEPSRPVVDALDAAFYAAFGAVEPAGKRMLLALDVSGSMGAQIGGLPLSCREASAALSLVTAATEPSYEIIGFTGSGSGFLRTPGVSPLSISPRQRLDDVIHVIDKLPFGNTDCALPMLYAIEHKLDVDTFVIYTDNETWAGDIHPHQALRRYRERSGIDARLVVVGMTSTKFSIADPTDAGMLDVVGLDTAVPTLITDFARGL